MIRLILSAFVILFVAVSCNRNVKKDNIQVVGDFDSSFIAHDTANEMAIETSYEYFKTLNVSEKLVYDLGAYNEPIGGTNEYVIIMRGADNQPDTVVKAALSGFIKSSWLCDINNNGQPELMFYSRQIKPDAKNRGEFVAYEMLKPDSGVKLEITGLETEPDTMYLEDNKVIAISSTGNVKTKLIFGALKDRKLILTQKQKL
ncbi:MAG TPA: hypothetical protein VG603_06205 [Chitinophagales bacterium]|nr:hypothetical protein [Chitinophagales bacterium]